MINILILLSPIFILPIFLVVGLEIEAIMEWNELIKQDSEKEHNAKRLK